LRYHPDKYPDTDLGHSRFLLIQEAYNILGNEYTRRNYDRECRLLGLHQQASTQYNAPALISELKELKRQLAQLNPSHIDRGLLYQILLHHFTQDKINSLLLHADAEELNQIVQLCLPSITLLPLAQQLELVNHLSILVQEIPEAATEITREQSRLKKKIFWRKTMPWIWFLLTLGLCLIMYWHGQLSTSFK